MTTSIMEDQRLARVADLKRQIADGTYVVDVDAVAAALAAIIFGVQSLPAGHEH